MRITRNRRLQPPGSFPSRCYHFVHPRSNPTCERYSLTPLGFLRNPTSACRTVALLSAVAASVVILLLSAGGGGVELASADGNCASHYPYKVIDGHSRSHDRDRDGVGCEANPRWPGSSTASPSAGSTATTGYDRDNWSYNSSAARRRLGCSSSEHVDHIVALKEAYDSSASSWSVARKRQFANDPLNQWCLAAALNQSKSDGDLAEWSGGSCSQRKYIAAFTIAVKTRYRLSIDPAERRANAAALAAECSATPVTQGAQTTVSTGTTTETTLPNPSLSLRNARSVDQSVTIPDPSVELAAQWTAAYLFSLFSEHGVIALWQWSPTEWLFYAEVNGVAVPGSTNFTVRAHDSVRITLN